MQYIQFQLKERMYMQAEIQALSPVGNFRHHCPTLQKETGITGHINDCKTWQRRLGERLCRVWRQLVITVSSRCALLEIEDASEKAVITDQHGGGVEVPPHIGVTDGE